jgi:hypothetical protein
MRPLVTWSAAILLIVALLYPHGGAGAGTLVPIETFQTLPSNLQSGAVVAMNNPTLFCTLSKAFPASFADSKSTLLYRTCMGVADPDADYMERLDQYFHSVSYYVDVIELRSNKFDDVVREIERSLERVFNNNRKESLIGPIYSLIFQAPYFRDMRSSIAEDARVIHLQPFNISEYKYMSSGQLHDQTSGMNDYELPEGILMKVFVMYPMYDKTMRPFNASEVSRVGMVKTCTDFFLSQSTSEKMCRLRCPSNTDFTCGCANRKENKGYKSVCLGPSEKDDRQKIELVTYGSMYRINESSPNITNMFTLSNTFADDCTKPAR